MDAPLDHHRYRGGQLLRIRTLRNRIQHSVRLFNHAPTFQTLDLGCVNELFAPLTHKNLSALFPNARRVRLFGDMRLGLASSILHTGDPSRFSPSLAMISEASVNKLPAYPSTPLTMV